MSRNICSHCTTQLRLLTLRPVHTLIRLQTYQKALFTGRFLLLALLFAHRLRFNSLRLFLSICSSRKASLEAVSDMSGSVRPVTVDRVAAAYGRGTFCVPRPGRVRNVFRQMHEDINAPPCTQRDILPVHVNMILTHSVFFRQEDIRDVEHVVDVVVSPHTDLDLPLSVCIPDVSIHRTTSCRPLQGPVHAD